MSKITWYKQFDGITEIGVKDNSGPAYGYAVIQKIGDRYKFRITIDKHHRHWIDDAKGNAPMKWAWGWTDWHFASTIEEAKYKAENYIWEYIGGECGRFVPENKQACKRENRKWKK